MYVCPRQIAFRKSKLCPGQSVGIKTGLLFIVKPEASPNSLNDVNPIILIYAVKVLICTGWCQRESTIRNLIINYLFFYQRGAENKFVNSWSCLSQNTRPTHKIHIRHPVPGFRNAECRFVWILDIEESMFNLRQSCGISRTMANIQYDNRLKGRHLKPKWQFNGIYK